jgi:hypothetical protein
MDTRQSNMLASLHNTRAFLEENADKLGGIAKTGMRKKLDDEIAGLTTLELDQAGTMLLAKGTTQKHRALREALLRDHIGPLVGIAAVELPRTPEVEPLHMPKGRPSAESLARAAYAMAQAAAPFSEAFVAAGLPADFLAQLTGAADAMIESVRARSQTEGKRSGATAGLDAKLKAGRKIVRALDRLMASALKDDPALLSNWKAVQRVRRTARADAAAPVAPVATLAVVAPVSDAASEGTRTAA